MTAAEQASCRTGAEVPADAAEARSLVSGLLGTAAARAGPVPSGSARADILLVTSELVTNAYRHGGGLTGFTAEVDRRGVTLTVTDASPDVPSSPSVHSPLSEGGFGWPLVRLLADAVSVHLLPDDGKTIEVHLSLT